MDIHEESVGLPSAHFLDGDGVTAIEVHGHRTSSTEGVAADIRFGISKGVEASFVGGCFESSIDVVSGDLAPGAIERVLIVENASSWVASVCDDVIHTTC
jgi:hypothetical protein